MTSKRSAAVLIVASLLAAACGSDDDTADDQAIDTTATTDTEAPTDTGPADTEAPADTEPAADEPVTGPATIIADDQVGDGETVTVASVSLPTEGYVVIHADSGGAPGAILGWSDLLPSGDNEDVVVTLQETIAETATVFPMAHVDANGNGEYEFMPPDVTIDVPATTAEGDVAVLPIEYEVTGSSDTGTTETGTTDAETGDEEAAEGQGGVLDLASSDLGEIIVDGEGNTVYLFAPDSAGDSTCYDECEAAWPIVSEVTDVSDGLDDSLLGAHTRTTGDVQATYNGWPLYYFAADEAPGDTNGQGVGDVWYFVDATGTNITS